MFATLFDFQRDEPSSRSTAARDVQAYYDKHAHAAANLRKLVWLGAALLGLVGFAALASDEGHAAEGWKFVRANTPAK